MKSSFSPLDSRVLILSVLKHDSVLTKKLLGDAGIEAEICAGGNTLTSEIERGAGVLILDGQTLKPALTTQLHGYLKAQPAWSQLPILVIAGTRSPSLNLREGLPGIGTLPNVTLLEKPVRSATLVSIVQASLADRRRQYETKHLLQQLERSNSELNNFAHIASHDLQEPLRTVTSYVQLLQRSYRDKLGPEAHEYIAFAVEGTKRMKELISSLLTYSQVGASDIGLRNVNTEKVIGRALKALQAGIQEAGATVIVENPLPPMSGDPTLLVQLFQNLIHNAVKFRRKDVPVVVTIKANRQERRILFSVTDNGIGIAPKHLSDIFQVFKRLHSNDEYPGSGIGLAVCKKIVERHQGRMQVESVEGQGTMFLFTLPIAIEPAGATAAV